MNFHLAPPFQGVRPSLAGVNIVWPEDPVQGHDRGDTAHTFKQMRCWSCAKSFGVREPVDASTIYVCSHCHTFNQYDPAAPAADDRPSAPGPWAKIKALFQSPKRLDTVFATGPDGSVYEIPADQARTLLVGTTRRRELSHLPFHPNRGISASSADEVQGHGLSQSGDDETGAWCYHSGWEYGCYYDAESHTFDVGYHRHPYADERAIPARAEDFE